ncbi:MAG: tetratricopeptide repeat protein [Planctomycetes bacterium]|nr:tetratricopeptide repeat protein [Planctomycetota bacterium]
MVDTDKLSAKAQEALDKRNYDYAVDLAGQILEFNPSNAQARKILRASLVGKCEIQKTIPSPYLAFITGLIPVIKIYLFSLLKKYGQVLTAGEEFLSRNPYSVWGRLIVGTALENLNYTDSAIEEFEALVALNPRDVKAVKSLGELYRLKNDIKKAVHFYQMASSLKPSDLQTTRALKDLAALTTLNEGGWSTAKSSRDIVKDTKNAQELEKETQFVKDSDVPQEISRLKGIVGQNPQNPDNVRFLKKIGELQSRQKNFTGALATYEQALKLTPSDGSLAMKIGDIKVQLFDERIRDLQHKLKSEPGSQPLKESLAKAQQEKNTFRIEEYRQRVQLYPTNLIYRYQLGRAFYDTKMFDEAVAEFQASLRDHKLRTDSLNYLGLCFIAKKLYDMAIGQFTKALDSGVLTNDYTKAVRYNLGLAYEYNQNREQAISEYKKIMEVDINYRDVSDRVNKLQAAAK